MLWPPPRTASSSPRSRPSRTAAATSARSGAAGDQRRAPVDRAVPDLAGLVVAAVAGAISARPRTSWSAMTSPSHGSRRPGKSTIWTYQGRRRWETGPVEVRTYGQYCPIARATEILAMRWTPIIVRNLLLGCETFGELMDGAPGISRTLLSSRLELLERYGVVERVPSARGSRYLLTDAGRDLDDVVHAMGTWGARWLEADAGALRLPHRPVVAVPADGCRRPARPAARDPLRAERRRPSGASGSCSCPPDSEVCVKPPGYDEDLVVTHELGVAGEVAHGPDLARAGDARGADLGRGAERAGADAVHAWPEPLRRRRAGSPLACRAWIAQSRGGRRCCRRCWWRPWRSRSASRCRNRSSRTGAGSPARRRGAAARWQPARSCGFRSGWCWSARRCRACRC